MSERGERLVAGIYGLAKDDSRSPDPASIRRLARKFWQESGGAMMTPEQLDCLSERARREVAAVMTQIHGKRRGG